MEKKLNMSFPILYKKVNTRTIHFWSVHVYEDSDHSSSYCIVVEYGKLYTDKPQTSHDTIFEGKNIGKANETSVKDQATAEAQAKWEKQKKNGYVESLEDAQNNKLRETE